MKTEAEVGGMQPQPKGRLEPLEAGKGGNDSPWSLRREPGPDDTLNSDSSPQNCEDTFLAVVTEALGNLYSHSARSARARTPGSNRHLGPFIAFICE